MLISEHRRKSKDHRPQGSDYCLGFVMNASTNWKVKECVSKRAFIPVIAAATFGQMNVRRLRVFYINCSRTAFSANRLSLTECAPSSPWRRQRLPQHKRQSTSKLALHMQHGAGNNTGWVYMSANYGWDRNGMRVTYAAYVPLLCLLIDNCQLALASKLASMNRPPFSSTVSTRAGHYRDVLRL